MYTFNNNNRIATNLIHKNSLSVFISSKIAKGFKSCKITRTSFIIELKIRQFYSQIVYAYVYKNSILIF